jgi:hypothetical protein
MLRITALHVLALFCLINCSFCFIAPASFRIAQLCRPHAMTGSESTSPTLRNGNFKQCQALMSEQSSLKSADSNAGPTGALNSSSRDNNSMRSKISSLLLCGLLAFGQGIPAMSDTVSPVFDEAKSLGSGQAKKIAAELSAFEEKTGWKIRVLTRDSRRQEQRATPQQIRELWKLPDDDAVRPYPARAPSFRCSLPSLP